MKNPQSYGNTLPKTHAKYIIISSSFDRKLALPPLIKLCTRHLRRRRGPILTPFSFLEVLDINVIEPLIQSCSALTLEPDAPTAESAPEVRLAIQIKAVICRRGDLMLLHSVLV